MIVKDIINILDKWCPTEHPCTSDKIIEGVLKNLSWEGEFDGNKKFCLKASKSICEIKSDIEKSLNLKNVRLTGDNTQNIKNISMSVGVADKTGNLLKAN